MPVVESRIKNYMDDVLVRRLTAEPVERTQAESPQGECQSDKVNAANIGRSIGDHGTEPNDEKCDFFCKQRSHNPASVHEKPQRPDLGHKHAWERDGRIKPLRDANLSHSVAKLRNEAKDLAYQERPRFMFFRLPCGLASEDDRNAKSPI